MSEQEVGHHIFSKPQTDGILDDITKIVEELADESESISWKKRCKRAIFDLVNLQILIKSIID
jgi:hypothetical protein